MQFHISNALWLSFLLSSASAITIPKFVEAPKPKSVPETPVGRPGRGPGEGPGTDSPYPRPIHITPEDITPPKPGKKSDEQFSEAKDALEELVENLFEDQLEKLACDVLVVPQSCTTRGES